MSTKTNTKWAIKSITDYIKKKYSIKLSKEDSDFLNAIIQDVRAEAFSIGYGECFDEDE